MQCLFSVPIFGIPQDFYGNLYGMEKVTEVAPVQLEALRKVEVRFIADIAFLPLPTFVNRPRASRAGELITSIEATQIWQGKCN